MILDEKCIQCGVQAHYTATKGGTVIHFCGSHTRKHAETLKNQGYDIVPDSYNEYGVENELYSTPTSVENEQTSEEEIIREIKHNIQHMFNENPLGVVVGIFVPETQKITGYNKDIKVMVDVSQPGMVRVAFEPATKLTTEQEKLDYDRFEKTVFSMMNSILSD